MKALKLESARYINLVETSIQQCYAATTEPTNEQLMALYAIVGQAIVKQGEKAFVVFLGDYLKCKFAALKGFSPRNLRRMRNFYLTYQNNAARMAQAKKLNWTQNVIIMECCSSDAQRFFYMELAAQKNLSKLALMDAIEQSMHENQEDEFDCTVSAPMCSHVEEFANTEGSCPMKQQNARVKKIAAQFRCCLRLKTRKIFYWHESKKKAKRKFIPSSQKWGKQTPNVPLTPF